MALLFLPLGAYDLRPFPLYMWDASYADYWQSPQFKAFIRDSNVYAYWREHGFPPQCRAVGDDDFECK